MIRSYFDHVPQVAATAFVESTAWVCGQVRIGEDSSIWPYAVLRGDVQAIEIGSRSNIQDGCILHVTSPCAEFPDGLGLSVGDGVTVGHGVILHACCIEDDCLIGMGSRVLDGARVRCGAMLGANSMVPPGKELEGGYLWLGSPAKKIRPLSASEQEAIRKSASGYVALKRKHEENATR